MDGLNRLKVMELLQGHSFFLTTKFPEYLVLISSTLEGWTAELTLKLLSGFEPKTPQLGIQHLND